MPTRSKRELPIRIVLIAPPKGVTYGIQRGRGASYDVDFAQQSKRTDIVFDFSVTVVDQAGKPNFLGQYVQGPAGRRFIYVDVGKYAGQQDTPWARRMIVRLDDVTWPLVEKATNTGKRIEARIRGTADDGGPNCATVDIINGWRIIPE